MLSSQQIRDFSRAPNNFRRRVKAGIVKVKVEKLRPFFNSHTPLPHGIQTDADAKVFSKELQPGERKLLFDALRKITADQYNEHKKVVDVTIHHEDLVKIWYLNFVPMFIYGCLDEALIIIGGESINNLFSVYNGMSMLASAAVANIIVNLFLQLPADRWTDILGFKKPVLSNDQMNTPEYHYASFAAKLCGLWLGLTLGILPLFFIDDNLDNRAHDSQEFLSGTKSEWFVMDDQNRKVNADEYCEVFSGE
ncbi:hypothetical protein CRE_15723 [Caenorhabditis remanei]|uniref:Transmembrane protein 65 n=1 Tax=Caenorhabditis remanei TaxID=31234 RepID=E3NFB3_CAERE|nr:hypothetical protein CRE_15723 [Caenorhabditis remanei]